MDTSMHKYTVYVTKQENGYKKPGKQQRNTKEAKSSLKVLMTLHTFCFWLIDYA